MLTSPGFCASTRSYDAIASLEMGEHVGAAGYPAFCAALRGRLRPGGRLLIQQMSRGKVAPGGGPFIESYVAADMHMRPVGETIGLLERAGLDPTEMFDWDGSRPILRVYDVSCIHFTGLNAHRIQDHHLSGIAGEMFINLPSPGTWQLGEVGFLLRNGEFIPAARSPVVPFGLEAPSRHGGQAALLVTAPGKMEPVGNVWDQEHELRERRRPNLRHPLRIGKSYGIVQIAQRKVRPLRTAY